MMYLNISRIKTSACSERVANDLRTIQRTMEMHEACEKAHEQLINLELSFPVYYHISRVPRSASKKFIEAIPLR